MNPTDTRNGQSHIDTQRVLVVAGPNPATDQRSVDAQITGVGGGPNTRNGHWLDDTHRCIAVAGPNTPSSQRFSDTHDAPAAGGPNTRDGQSAGDTHQRRAVAGPNPATDHSPPDAQGVGVGGGPNPVPTSQRALDTHYQGADGDGPNTPSSQREIDTHVALAAGGPNTPGDQRTFDNQAPSVAGAPNTRNGHGCIDSQSGRAVAGPHLHANQTSTDNHSRSVGVDPTPEPANEAATPRAAPPVRAQAGSDHIQDDTHVPCVAAPNSPPVLANAQPTPMIGAPVLADPVPGLLADPILGALADVLDDLERVRIANENRLRQFTRTETDTDGEERGFGLTQDHPAVARLAGLVDGITQAEHQAELNLKHQLRQHPLHPWIKTQRGIGEKQAARLLATIGDPYWHTLNNRPRTVSELWSYSGHGDATEQVRRKGQRDSWSATAKMRVHLIAEKIVVVGAGGPWRELYDQTKAHYADATHRDECKRCGPSGKPAQPGSPLSDGHKHGRALRKVAKEVLKGLWREAKRLHEEAAT